MSIFTKFIGMRHESSGNAEYSYLGGNMGVEGASQQDVKAPLEEEKGPLQELWEKFDYKYMQPIFLKEMMP